RSGRGRADGHGRSCGPHHCSFWINSSILFRTGSGVWPRAARGILRAVAGRPDSAEEMTVGDLTTSSRRGGAVSGRLARIAVGGPAGRGFAELWGASAAAGAGDGTALTAGPLLAFTLTRDPRLIAGVTAALTLPYLLFSWPAGVLIDRADRRRAMARVAAFRAVLLAGFTVHVITHAVGLLARYACFFLIGTFFRNSSQTLIPQVVGREALPLANGRMMGAEIVMNELGGPMKGGLLFAIAPPVPFGIDAA